MELDWEEKRFKQGKLAVLKSDFQDGMISHVLLRCVHDSELMSTLTSEEQAWFYASVDMARFWEREMLAGFLKKFSQDL